MADDEAFESWCSQVRKGLLELALLTRLARGRAYGYELVAGLKRHPAFADLVEGTIYPVLARLKGDGYLDAEWVAADGGPARKYYSITKSGRAMLRRMTDRWAEIQSALSGSGS
ncbi:MAG: PadR family transcriptional regulator [Pseudomonadota bacterium]